MCKIDARSTHWRIHINSIVQKIHSKASLLQKYHSASSSSIRIGPRRRRLNHFRKPSTRFLRQTPNTAPFRHNFPSRRQNFPNRSTPVSHNLNISRTNLSVTSSRQGTQLHQAKLNNHFLEALKDLTQQPTILLPVGAPGFSFLVRRPPWVQ